MLKYVLLPTKTKFLFQSNISISRSPLPAWFFFLGGGFLLILSYSMIARCAGRFQLLRGTCFKHIIVCRSPTQPRVIKHIWAYCWACFIFFKGCKDLWAVLLQTPSSKLDNYRPAPQDGPSYRSLLNNLKQYLRYGFVLIYLVFHRKKPVPTVVCVHTTCGIVVYHPPYRVNICYLICALN